jgi:putative transposase
LITLFAPQTLFKAKTRTGAVRVTTFRYTLDPTPAQQARLLRHAGAARFAYNQCLRMVKAGLAARKMDSATRVPWTGFDLINAFNTWKVSEAAGRRFIAARDGTVEKETTGLAWRLEVSQQVFEEAAVDLGHGLAAWAASQGRKSAGPPVRFPTFKEKRRSRPSFRLRNKGGASKARIRIGVGHPRSVTLPSLGTLRVRDDTRALRRLLRPAQRPNPTTGRPRHASRARILHATITRHADRWHVSLTVEAPDLHPARRYPARPTRDHGGWVGLDRGLTHLLVAATGDRVEIGRWAPPRCLARALPRLQRQARTVSRRDNGSVRHTKASRRLARTHARIANQRRWWLHQVTNQLVKTHDRLVLETLAVSNLLRNHRLARAIADAAWGELDRQLAYKQRWHGGQIRYADRWYASSKTCSRCGQVTRALALAERVFRCGVCGLVCDRDINAAANLAAWAEMASKADAQAPDLQEAAGSPTPVEAQGSSRTTGRAPGPLKREPTLGRLP